ncbi:hypothetical protein Vadar_006164 [Vaccinium darrowii]|uniref:Uncharacterized protein n=1 Tax=Vaccinium darrowii TaxID=229202 RepID=A0ACB7YJS1_9ERIC|nr:hypothetical protein Vadar_006164 [Vaccinium darrowii]
MKLADRFNPDNQTLEFKNGRVFPIMEEDVARVLGLPIGDIPVPNVCEGIHRDKMNDYFQEFKAILAKRRKCPAVGAIPVWFWSDEVLRRVDVLSLIRRVMRKDGFMAPIKAYHDEIHTFLKRLKNLRKWDDDLSMLRDVQVQSPDGCERFGGKRLPCKEEGPSVHNLEIPFTDGGEKGVDDTNFLDENAHTHGDKEVNPIQGHVEAQTPGQKQVQGYHSRARDLIMMDELEHMEEGKLHPKRHIFHPDFAINLVNANDSNFNTYMRDACDVNKVHYDIRKCNMWNNLFTLLNDGQGVSRHTADEFEIVYPKVPQQDNGHDCGICLIKFMELWKGRMVSVELETDNMNNIRRSILYSLFTDERNEQRDSILAAINN